MLGVLEASAAFDFGSAGGSLASYADVIASSLSVVRRFISLSG